MKLHNSHYFPPPWFNLEKYAAVKSFTAVDWLRQLKIRAELRHVLEKSFWGEVAKDSPLTTIANLCFEYGVITKEALGQGKTLATDLSNIYSHIPRENLLRNHTVILLPEIPIKFAIERQTLYFFLSSAKNEWSLVYALNDKREQFTAEELQNIEGLVALLNEHWFYTKDSLASNPLFSATRCSSEYYRNNKIDEQKNEQLKDKEKIGLLHERILKLIEPRLLEKHGKNPWLYNYEPTARRKKLFNSVHPVQIGSILALRDQIERPDYLIKLLEDTTKARCMIDSGEMKYEYIRKHLHDEDFLRTLDCFNLPFDAYKVMCPEENLTGWRYDYGKPGFANLRVDLTSSDEQIIDDFKEVLKWYRKNVKLELPQIEKNISQTTFHKWAKNYVLPYIDLRIWAAMHHKTLRYHDYALAISSGIKDLSEADTFSDDAIRRTTHPMAVSALSNTVLRILAIQVHPTGKLEEMAMTDF